MNGNLDPAALKSEIEAAYAVSGNHLGWRLLSSPATVLEGAKVAFIGLNPGGNAVHPGHAEFSMSSGSAFAVEEWAGHPPGQSPLQRQVLTLFDGLGVEPEKVLAGNLVPFRSPDWASLENPHEALRFGCKLWITILNHARPRLIIGMGAAATNALAAILKADDVVTVPVGWGRVTATRRTFSDGILVGLPHLSRFGIMTRTESGSALRDLFDGWWRR